MNLLPHDRHRGTVDPGVHRAGEAGGREHLVVGVHVHQVLLALHLEVGEPRGDRVLVVGDVDLVVDDAPRVRHPVAADHVAVLGLLPVGVAEAAVPPGEAGAALDRVEQALERLLGDRAHGPDLDDEVDRLHEGGVGVGRLGVGGHHLEAVSSASTARRGRGTSPARGRPSRRRRRGPSSSRGVAGIRRSGRRPGRRGRAPRGRLPPRASRSPAVPGSSRTWCLLGVARRREHTRRPAQRGGGSPRSSQSSGSGAGATASRRAFLHAARASHVPEYFPTSS